MAENNNMLGSTQQFMFDEPTSDFADPSGTQAFDDNTLGSTQQFAANDSLMPPPGMDSIMEADRFIDMQLEALSQDPNKSTLAPTPSASNIIQSVLQDTQQFQVNESPQSPGENDSVASCNVDPIGTQAFVSADDSLQNESSLHLDDSVINDTATFDVNTQNKIIDEHRSNVLVSLGPPESPQQIIHHEQHIVAQTSGPASPIGGGPASPSGEPPASPSFDETSNDGLTVVANLEETPVEEGNSPKSPMGEAPESPCGQVDQIEEEAVPANEPMPVVEDDGQQDMNVQQDDAQDDGDAIESGPSGSRVIVSDDDSDDQGHKPKQTNEVEKDKDDDANSQVGELIADIFGDSDAEQHSDNEQGVDEDSAVAKETSGKEEEDEVGRPDDDDRPSNLEWDFDVMMQKKKLEGGRRRRRRRDGSIDLYADADELIKELVHQMKQAAEEDRNLNTARKPALNKRKMLAAVVSQLKKGDLHEAFVDFGVVGAIAEWLAPLPDRSLPALEIRKHLLNILNQFPRMEPSILRQSGIGKAVMLLFKHPKEIKVNRDKARTLISEWARPIFELDTDFRSLTKKDREQRDYELMPAAKKKRLSVDGAEETAAQELEETLRPGDKGFINRARVPRPSTKDYVIRPKWKVEGEFKGSSKVAANPFDKKIREFKDKQKANKNSHAVSVSLQGNKMQM